MSPGTLGRLAGCESQVLAGPERGAAGTPDTKCHYAKPVHATPVGTASLVPCVPANSSRRMPSRNLSGAAGRWSFTRTNCLLGINSGRRFAAAGAGLVDQAGNDVRQGTPLTLKLDHDTPHCALNYWGGRLERAGTTRNATERLGTTRDNSARPTTTRDQPTQRTRRNETEHLRRRRRYAGRYPERAVGYLQVRTQQRGGGDGYKRRGTKTDAGGYLEQNTLHDYTLERDTRN